MENIWQKYAKVLVEYSTKIKKDDKVIIRAEAQAQPLVKAVYEEVLKRIFVSKTLFFGRVLSSYRI